MKRLLLLPLILLTINAFSQYHPTAVKGRQWNQYYPDLWFGGGVFEMLEVGSDTSIGGKTFSKVNAIDTSGNQIALSYLIAEDTVTPSLKLYSVYQGQINDSMFLDFSINIGDSIQFLCTNQDTLYSVLDTVETYTDLTNTTRAWYHYTIHGFWTFRFNWIEGLGYFNGSGSSIGGLANYYTYYPCITDVPFPQLICVSDSNGISLIKSPLYKTCIPDGIGLAENPLSAVKVFPNPFNDFLALEGIPAQKSVHLQLIAPTGEMVMELPFEENTPIDLSALNSGIYILQVKSDGNVKSFKVVKE